MTRAEFWLQHLADYNSLITETFAPMLRGTSLVRMVLTTCTEPRAMGPFGEARLVFQDDKDARAFATAFSSRYSLIVAQAKTHNMTVLLHHEPNQHPYDEYTVLIHFKILTKKDTEQ